MRYQPSSGKNSKTLSRLGVRLFHLKDYDSASTAIINVDNNHWICVWVDDEGRLTFFDSTGTHPKLYGLRSSFRNEKRYQPSESSTCGWYCLWFLFHMARGVSVKQMDDYYSLKSPEELDVQVKWIFNIHKSQESDRLKIIFSHHSQSLSNMGQAVKYVKAAEVRDAWTPRMKQKLTELMTEITYLWGRESKLNYVLDFFENLDDEETKKIVEMTFRREREHNEFVNGLLKDLRIKSNHNWSKDGLFVAVMVSHFDAGVKNIETLVDHELLRHHSLEAHHPEHEDVYGECSNRDILEMVIDRLTLNIQSGDTGVIDHGVMMNSTPTFRWGDTEAKRHLYCDYVLRYSSYVQNHYSEHW